MWYKQFKQLCDKNNTTPTAFVTKELNLSSSKVTAWSKGAIPKYEILQQIAEYFNVTIGYLFDGKEEYSMSDLTDAEQEMIQKFRCLLEIDKARVLERMETILDGYENAETKNAEIA